MARAVVSVRVAGPAVDKIDALANDSKVQRTDVLRAALFVALQNETALRKAIRDMKDRP